MHGHACGAGADREHPPADNPNDRFVVAVKGNAGQQGEAEAVRVKRHDPEPFALVDRISQMLRLDGDDFRHRTDIAGGFLLQLDLFSSVSFLLLIVIIHRRKPLFNCFHKI